jgi:hypothetical protein
MGLRNWWRWRDDRRYYAVLGAVCALGLATAADVVYLTGYQVRAKAGAS